MHPNCECHYESVWSLVLAPPWCTLLSGTPARMHCAIPENSNLCIHYDLWCCIHFSHTLWTCSCRNKAVMQKREGARKPKVTNVRALDLASQWKKKIHLHCSCLSLSHAPHSHCGPAHYGNTSKINQFFIMHHCWCRNWKGRHSMNFREKFSMIRMLQITESSFNSTNRDATALDGYIVHVLFLFIHMSTQGMTILSGASNCSWEIT